MSDADTADKRHDLQQQVVVRGTPSAFEQLITTKPPVLESLLAQLPTESILALYYTSSYLKQFFKNSPTSWRYISMRLHQPVVQTVTLPAANSSTPTTRQTSNYSLDKMLLYVIHPFSTRLTSLELDNTSVSGATVFQTVMARRTDTLEHVSVRGCKNVSLKYHINPWLMMHAMALDVPTIDRPPGYEKLALKSLYTYRCRHHRRRPYLPSSLARKESDSEPTHELVLTCHKLGIWTDTAWCTTPGARCFRRRGYVTMRIPQDPREVWVVFDRLWRSRNWIGPLPDTKHSNAVLPNRKRKRDCRSWEVDEEAMNGEPLGTTGDGKATPAHARSTHKQFVEDVYCDNCSDPILERCEQCSVMMHCSGCRKTLCASCAFDRPYLRNKAAPVEERNKIWWAPGCAVSPCSMLDQDSPPPGPAGNVAQAQQTLALPSIKFKWCCTEPVFSGGGGITFGSGATRESDRIRAAPLKMGNGWEDPEFSTNLDACNDENVTPGGDQHQIGLPLSRADNLSGPIGGRWPSIDDLFQSDHGPNSDHGPVNVPRILCDECHSSEQWKIKCKACSMALCLKHDVKERLKVRICGYKDLSVEKSEYRSRQKALKLLILTLRRRYGKVKAAEEKEVIGTQSSMKEDQPTETSTDNGGSETSTGPETPRPVRSAQQSRMINSRDLEALINGDRAHVSDSDTPARPVSPGSNSTGPPSRATSPTPSTRSIPATPEPKNALRLMNAETTPPLWKGCQSFFCPSTRSPGDHRRRCVAIMRQCAECKIHVCEQCTTGLAPPCPCKGCRPTDADGRPNETLFDEALRFFCPNCRWSRRKNGKCKRRITEVKSKRSKKKTNDIKQKKRHRKPIEERQSHQPNHWQDDSNDPDRLYEHVAEFMELLRINASDDGTDELVMTSTGAQAGAQEGANDGTASKVAGKGGAEDYQQLEDMGALARDLIQRIQVLRQQFGPGSMAALALPNITVQDPVLRAVQEQVEASASQRTEQHDLESTTVGTSTGAVSTHTTLPLQESTEEAVTTQEGDDDIERSESNQNTGDC